MEANSQIVTGVPFFPQLAGARAGEGELEEWEVIDPDRVRLRCKATRWVDVKCEQGVACLCWQLAWLGTVEINSAELHAREKRGRSIRDVD